MCAEFEGNPITRLHFMAVFCKCAKRKKIKENDQIFEGLYFRIGWHDLLQMWFVSPNKPVPVQLIWSCLVKRPWSYERA